MHVVILRSKQSNKVDLLHVKKKVIYAHKCLEAIILCNFYITHIFSEVKISKEYKGSVDA